MSVRNFSKPLTATILAMLAGYGAGCAATPPPPELLDARSAYIRAESGPAAQLKPDSVHEAKVALDKAERAYSDDPSDQKTRDVAYVAARRAQRAEVEGRDAKAANDKVRAERELASLNQMQLSRTRQQLASASERVSSTEQQLANERAIREASEARMNEVMEKLAATSANVRKDARGIIITVPGAVLFASGKSSMLPGAQSKLTTVADALKEARTAKEIVVEGHTDSTGSDATNMTLSQTRADNVRDFLVARGVPANRIRAKGVGESSPVADNRTAEGRANNRRVEIIITPAEGESQTPQQ